MQRILFALPRDPVIPGKVRPRDGFVTRLKLRLEGQRGTDGIGCLPELRRNRLQSVKVNTVGADAFEFLRHCSSEIASSRVPVSQTRREEDSYATTVKLLNQVAEAG